MPAKKLIISPVSKVYPKLNIEPEPNIISKIATIALVKFPSNTELNAFSYPFLMACLTLSPFAISSHIRSEIITLASTAIPNDKITPAIPGNVKVN